jgi:hypothetical protein
MTGELRPNPSPIVPHRSVGFDWYSRIPFHDRRAVDAVAKWLRPIPWQWFVTLTFPWDVRDATAVRKLRLLLNELEKHHKGDVCAVAGQESKPRQDGMRVPWHFHLLLASHHSISKECIEAIWRGLVCRASDRKAWEESVQVEPYEAEERGPEYCLKSMNDGFGDWHIHRLELFLPYSPSKPDHRTIRGARRARLRSANLDSARIE